jgi:hypothetical protein
LVQTDLDKSADVWRAETFTMRRRTFDAVLTSIGAVLTLVVLVAGGLLMWGYSFANSSVHDQLAAQQIYFPAKGSDALKPSDIGPYLNKYAGQQLVDGAQAKAYFFGKRAFRRVPMGVLNCWVGYKGKMNESESP